MAATNSSAPTVDTGVETTYNVRFLFEQFIRHGYEIDEHSKWTMRTRASHLKYFVEYCERTNVNDIRQVTNPIIDEFYIEYRQTRSKATVNTAKRILKCFIRWTEGYKEIQVRAKPDAIRLVRVRNQLPRAVDDSLVVKTIQNAVNKQDKLMVATLREAGLRVSEFTRIRVCDLLIDQLRVLEGKGDVDRHVFITPELASALRHFAIENERTGNDWLFQQVYRGYGSQMSTKVVRSRVAKCFKNAVDLDVTPHQLRHTMAIELLRNGCDLVTIQKQLGHEDLETTRQYLRVDDQFVRDGYAKAMPNSILRS